jgi:hypothetical protein
MGEMTKKTAALRRPGAAALDLAYVAAGFSDGFFESGLQPWDTAAGSLLITEAGGLVGNYSGEANFLHEKECMAASPKIYAQMAHILSPFSKVSREKPLDASTFEHNDDDSEGPHESTPAELAVPTPTTSKRLQRVKGEPMSIKQNGHDTPPRRPRTPTSR